MVSPLKEVIVAQFLFLGTNYYEKNAQKKDKKKKISETMNKIIPHFIPETTLKVLSP